MGQNFAIFPAKFEKFGFQITILSNNFCGNLIKKFVSMFSEHWQITFQSSNNPKE